MIVAAVGAVGIVGVVATVNHSDHSDYGNYSDHSDYSDHVERENRIKKQKERDLISSTEETHEYVEKTINEFSETHGIDIKIQKGYGDSADTIEELVKTANDKITKQLKKNVANEGESCQEIKDAKKEIEEIDKLITRINEIKLGNDK